MSDPQEDYLDLPDDEFEKMAAPPFVEQEVIEDHEETSDEGEDSSQEAMEIEKTPEADPGAEGAEPGEEADNDTGADLIDSPDTGGSEEEDSAEKTSEETEKPDEDGADAVPLVDYKSEYEKLMAPFKANGVDMQARSIDDAIQLMQMGAGFHKKMAALKPAMKQMKLLERNGLLEDDKLNYLIDLHKKNPEAIQKLLKDSKLDPLDIDLNQDTTYKPTDRKVSDKDLALDEVLDEVRETPTFQKTLNVVSKEWDESSQDRVASEPQIISIINGHIADGTFDAVTRRVDYERSLGRLKGVSDYEAYERMGNAMADEGLLQRTGAPQQQAASLQSVQPSKAKPSKKEIERKQKKRAASPIKGSRATAEPVFNPLEVSDEDFAKLDINKYIKSK